MDRCRRSKMGLGFFQLIFGQKRAAKTVLGDEIIARDLKCVRPQRHIVAPVADLAMCNEREPK